MSIPGLFYRGLHFKAPIIFGTVPLAAPPSAPPAGIVDGIIPVKDGKTEPSSNGTGIGWNFGQDNKNGLYPSIRECFHNITIFKKNTYFIYLRFCLFAFVASPTFEEALITSDTNINIRDKDDSEHTVITGGFLPRYPTYNFNNTNNKS